MLYEFSALINSIEMEIEEKWMGRGRRKAGGGNRRRGRSRNWSVCKINKKFN